MDRITLRDKFGYSSAAVGDSVGYMLVTTFIMFFLTTVAGLQPAIAGTLTALGSIWDALVNPIIGYLSDHCRSRHGRRRPFMFFFSFPLMISMVLLFTAVEVTYTVKVIYYGLMVIVFWTSFTGFFVPYYALGAEYTRDYDERTSIRSYVAFFNMIGTLFSMALPTTLVEIMGKAGLSEKAAWMITAAFLGVLTAVSIIITVAVSGDKDKPLDEETENPEEKLNIGNMGREYIQVLKLGPLRWLLLTSLFYLMAYAIMMSDFAYLLTYNLGFSGGGVSLGMAARGVICLLFIPIVTRICKSFDKKSVQIAIIIIGGIGLVILRFAPMAGILVPVIYVALMGLVTQTYWQIMPAVFYDVCEYDEYETGQRREGSILAVQGLIESAASGLGAQFLGIVLQLAGFNGSVSQQSALALEWVYNCATWVPVVFLFVAGFALFRFPITRKVYNDIVKSLEERKETEQ